MDLRTEQPKLEWLPATNVRMSFKFWSRRQLCRIRLSYLTRRPALSKLKTLGSVFLLKPKLA
jgi:hypothetical protein